MSSASSPEYKIEDPAEMKVLKHAKLDRHPGVFIRDVLLPEHGITKIAPLAVLLKVNRPNLHEVLSGKREVTRELAYRLGALLGDPVADLIIAYKNAWDLQEERGRREELRGEIEPLERAEA